MPEQGKAISDEHKVSVTFEGAEPIDIGCREDEDVVTAALRQGYLLMSECRQGSCATCRGLLVDGDYDELLPHSPHALTGHEEEDGWILACRLQPRSDLAIDFDYPADRVGRYEADTRTGQVVAVERLSETVARMVVQTAAAQDPLDWEPGQYVRVTMPAVRATRDYSMANVPDGSRQLEFLVRILPGGRFSGHLATGRAVGEPVRVEGPRGSFTFRDDARSVFVAGGSGLAPILAMLRARAATDPRSPTTLVFGVTTEADLFCTDELAELTRAMAGLEVRTTVARPSPAWSGRSGLVTEHLPPAEPAGPAAGHYLCGPPPMVSAVHDLLAEQGVPGHQIHAERFLESGGET